MKKFLFISNSGSAKMSGTFSGAAISAVHSLGMEYHSVLNRQKTTAEQMKEDEAKFNIRMHHADIARAPLSKSNIKAYKQIVKLVKSEDIDYIHCNTPVGGLLGRLAGKKCKVKKVIYQAHGFHFYKGAPKINWLVYYPIEKWLARYTDALITINSEDFEFAKAKFKLRNNGKIYYVPGVGVDTTQFASYGNFREEKRLELGIPNDAFLIISAGELNTNKNNCVIISAMEKLQDKKIHYILCGVGEKMAQLQAQADAAGLHDNVHFLGYRNDVKELFTASDCFVMPSIREGLSRSIMEAMSSGLPCIVSAIRGNVDLISDSLGGFLCNSRDIDGFAKAIGTIANDAELRDRMKEYNIQKVKNFDVSVVKKEMTDIYKEVFGE